jgi:peptide/nickel transport system permease protein
MRDAWRRFLRHRLAVVGLGVIAILVVLAVGARVFSPHDPLRQDLPRALAGPSADFPLGTDEFGRCILSRILYGARLSLLVGVIATGIGASAGILSGLLAGYFPRVESVVMRTMTCSWRSRASCSPSPSSRRWGRACRTS